MLAGRGIEGPLSTHDNGFPRQSYPPWRNWEHRCWGPIDPAHVGKHRAQGAPDFGVTVPLCRAAHQFYDEHRDRWPKLTGYGQRKMASAAAGFALKYVERGGIPEHL